MTIKFAIFMLLVTFMLADGKKSFVIVLDASASMIDEINTLKRHIEHVIKPLPASGDFDNYVLVPFTDPDVGDPKTLPTPEGLLNSLTDVEVRGGDDCPENSLSAIEKALETSKEYSNIFLFTDAPAKDVNKLPLIQSLCRQRHSQVVTFLSGECPGEPGNNMNIYNEVAKSCSGTAFHLDIQNLRHALNYMKAIVNVEWSEINPHKEFIGRKQFSFNIDKYTKDIIIAVAGDFPEIQVTNALGETETMEKVLDTKRALVIRLLQPPVGEYVAEICSRGLSMTTFYKSKTLEFQYGFSPKIPRNLNETSNAPLPDATSYLIIEQLDDSIELFLLEIHWQVDGEKTTIELEVLDEDKRLYMVQKLFRSDKPFQISIHGSEKTTHEVIKGKSKLVYPQRKNKAHSTGAIVEAVMPESTLVEFMANVTLFCKVKGEPRPDIWWEDDNQNRIHSVNVLFEWPSTYISYATIENATTNATIHCKANNNEGESSLSTELFVHREFALEVIQNPSDITIEYGTEGKLFCEVKAYPEATLSWYHNGSIIENNENLEVLLEDNMLLIKSMGLDDTGEYTCEVSNAVNTMTFPAVVSISGIEAPLVEISASEQILKPGDSMEVECQVLEGKPTPEVIWKKEVDDEFVDIPDGVSVEDSTLKISFATGEHAGVYKCTASNILGADSKEVAVKVQYAPIIKKSDEIKMVNVGELVQLDCDADAKPKPIVHWDMYQDDVIIVLDERHSTDDQFTHHFIAQPQDSGIYYCIAENELGRSERKVTVDILEAPFIEPLEYKSLRARVGASLQVTCNVLLGRPVPVTRWEFISTKSSTSVLLRKTTAKLDLVLRNISKANEGYYQCVAENQVAPDSVKFYLAVVQ